MLGAAFCLPGWVGAAELCRTPTPKTIYVLGDSISYGLSRVGLEAQLRERFGSQVLISFDVGRSITSPGIQIKQSALQSVAQDQAFIAKADTVIVVLGSNQLEPSFANSQQVLMWQLKALAPDARYFWIDIGATLADQVAGWSARNQVIYDNAALLGYQVISRYKAIFGPDADPLNITPGRNFPNMETEPGFGVEGNLHGADDALAQAVVRALAAPDGPTASGMCQPGL
ncbi:MAG: hypothetical protein FD135_1504 [Comamonadaceae bacterium]|nr:MAG: hypothetical protein FD135_1504 [Comamonadaceae bacterium]